MFDTDDLSHPYSRAEASADDVLVDVSTTARDEGIRFPVALTGAVWERRVTVPPEYDPARGGAAVADGTAGPVGLPRRLPALRSAFGPPASVLGRRWPRRAGWQSTLPSSWPRRGVAWPWQTGGAPQPRRRVR
jgi:hypothetical protein